MAPDSFIPGIELKNITKIFDTVKALTNVNLTVSHGEFSVVVGPSGCGKSTLLRIISGLEAPTTGKIFINGKDITSVEASKRNIAMVFQDYALYPQMSVWQNIDFCLRLKKINKNERKSRVKKVIEILRLNSLERRKPASLSGGQKQRVALARAIVREPALFLFDEPLSNLDARLRLQTREEILAVHRNAGKCSLYVTHDQSEAMTMADQIIVLNNGIIQQQGTPQEVYQKPANIFVAGFFGTPIMNFLRVEKNDENETIRIGEKVIHGLSIPRNRRKAILGIRPENLTISERGQVGGFVEAAEFLGDHKTVAINFDNHIIWCKATQSLAVPGRGKKIYFSIDSDSLHWFDTETKKRLEE